MAPGNSPSSLIVSKESSSPSSSSLSSTSSSQSPTSPIVTQPQTPCPRPVAMEMDDWTSTQPINTFGQVTDFLDRHLQALRICVALLGVTGIVLIGRSIRVMKTFRAVSDIPEEFIRKQMTLRGKVRGHQDHHLLVEHLPIIRGMKAGTKTGQSESLLPVCLAGLHVSEGGLTHLVTMTPVDSLIWFRLLAVNEARQLECIVTRRKNFASSLMVNESLVRQGFARFKPAHPTVALHPTTVPLIQRLSKAELHAEKKAKGIWAKPPLRERMNERAREVKDGLKERLMSTMTPFTVGMNAIKAAGARVGAIIRWPKKRSKKG